MAARRLLFPQVGEVTWEAFDLPNRPEPHTVIAEAICSLISVGTELALYTGTHIGFTRPDPPFPMMPQRPGYALVGRVIAVGDAVEGIHAGQRVLMEAPHGTAPALEGKNLANPMAMILAGAAVLGYIRTPEAERGSRAIYESVFETVYEGKATTDLGGSLTTTDFTDEVIRRVETKLEVWAALG